MGTRNLASTDYFSQKIVPLESPCKSLRREQFFNAPQQKSEENWHYLYHRINSVEQACVTKMSLNRHNNNMNLYLLFYAFKRNKNITETKSESLRFTFYEGAVNLCYYDYSRDKEKSKLAGFGII